MLTPDMFNTEHKLIFIKLL